MALARRGWLERFGGGLGRAVAAYRAATAGDSGRQAGVTLLSDFERSQGVAADPHLGRDLGRVATSDDVYAAVNLLAECAATVPFEVRAGEEALDDHDLAELLRHPNAAQDAAAFWTRVVQLVLLTGECFILIDRTNLVDAALPNELHAFSGESLRPVPDREGGGLSHYLLRAGARKLAIPPADVVPVLLPHPETPYRGLSPLASLRLGLDAEAEAKAANRDLFANGMLTDGVLTVEGTLSPERRERFLADLRDRHQGRGQRHKIILAEAGKASFAPLRMTPRDAEFLELDKLTTRDVAKVYRVPEMFLSVLDHSTLANFEMGYRMLWELGVVPRWRRVASALTSHLAWQFGPGLSVGLDLSGVEALRENQAEQAGTIAALVGARFDPAFAFEHVTGQPAPDGAVLPEPAASPEPEPAPARRGPVLAVVTRVQRVQRRVTLYDRVESARAAHHGPMARRTHQGFAAQLDRLLARLDRLEGQRGAADDLVAVMFPDEAADPLEEAIFAGILSAAEGGIDAYETLFGLAVDDSRAGPVVEAWAREQAADEVKWINEHTRDLLREGISEALEAGEGLRGVRQRIMDAFGASDEPEQMTAYRDRVENIAQTELARGFGFGNLEAMLAAGLEETEWLWSGIPGSRHGPEQSKGNGQVRPAGAAFSLNGHPARYPADPQLPIGQAARCKCVVIPYDPSDGTPAEVDHG